MPKKAQKSDFPCSKCGACCRRAGQLPGFPLPTDKNGVCAYLSEENECEIYAVRPDICNIEALYHQFFAKRLSKSDYWKANAIVCNQMMDADGLDPELRIAIEEITDND